MYIDYEVRDRIATITLNRPEAANAQNPELLDELDAAWTRAAEDNEVAVIVLRANGKHFSAGHDLRGGGPVPDKITLEFVIQHEAKRYLEYTLRWRNVPKPSIAAVQGRCISGGLLLCWPCDLIIAADDAQFSDPVVLMGIGGVEYHGHTWELGPRKAKEILFTGRSMTAEEVAGTGMVNRVVPRDQLDSEDAAVRSATGQARREPDPRRAGVLRSDPVGLRHPSDRPRQRAERRRMARAGEPRRDEGQHQVARHLCASDRKLPYFRGVSVCKHSLAGPRLEVGEARRRAAGPQPRSGLPREFP